MRIFHSNLLTLLYAYFHVGKKKSNQQQSTASGKEQDLWWRRNDGWVVVNIQQSTNRTSFKFGDSHRNLVKQGADCICNSNRQIVKYPFDNKRLSVFSLHALLQRNFKHQWWLWDANLINKIELIYVPFYCFSFFVLIGWLKQIVLLVLWKSKNLERDVFWLWASFLWGSKTAGRISLFRTFLQICKLTLLRTGFISIFYDDKTFLFSYQMCM